MATAATIAHQPSAPYTRVVIPNKHGEKLVGLLHMTGSKKMVMLCHGFRSNKKEATMVNLSNAVTKIGFDSFRFDFSGNGESEGQFQYGGYKKEADDLHSVISHFRKDNYDIAAIAGHSKGGSVVVLYAATYDDVDLVLNLSGRFHLEQGIEERLGKDYMEKIKSEGRIDVKNRAGAVNYTVTEEALLDRLNTDIPAASRSIRKECRVVTVHGTKDEIIPVDDAYSFDKAIANHELRLIEGADHCFAKHQEELATVVVDVLKSNLVA